MDKENKKINEESGEREPVGEEQKKSSIRKASLAILIIVLFLFAVIVLFTDMMGKFLGKSAENIALVVIAAVLAFLLYQSKRSNKK